ncbi:uncharacterized protein DS421_20g706050 [Arachis hypogaea]|nr:uncharacterized protein DS421_20g706050 [Arachis hypogaea]
MVSLTEVFPFSGYGRRSFRRVIFIFCLFDIILYYLSFMFPSPLILQVFTRGIGF